MFNVPDDGSGLLLVPRVPTIRTGARTSFWNQLQALVQDGGQTACPHLRMGFIVSTLIQVVITAGSGWPQVVQLQAYSAVGVPMMWHGGDLQMVKVWPVLG